MNPLNPNAPTPEHTQARIERNSLSRSPNAEMGQDAFLRLLVEQLKNQDPTDPVKDKEFIAQMAQFNSLEQMIELNRGFKELQSSLGQNQALSLLGREVSVSIGRDREGQETLLTGRVDAVHPGDPTYISIDAQQHPLAAIRRVGP